MRSRSDDIKFDWIEKHIWLQKPRWRLQFQYRCNLGWKNFGIKTNQEFWLMLFRQDRLNFEWTHEWKNPRTFNWEKTKYELDCPVGSGTPGLGRIA